MKQRVVVAGLVNKADEYLFARQDEGFSPGKLVIPGGGVDLGESPEEALRREFMEETNIELKNLRPAHFDHYIGPYKNENYHLTFFQFRAEYAGGTPKAGDDVTELLWLKEDEIFNHPHNEATLRFLKFLGMGV